MTLPHHLGLGGAVQAGYKLAFELGFEYVIRVDGDGSTRPRIPRVFDVLQNSGCQMVIGSRYLKRQTHYTSTIAGVRHRGIPHGLRPILGKWVYDPTSGFVGVNREALALFSRSFPLEYPEIEALVVLQAQGVPVRRGCRATCGRARRARARLRRSSRSTTSFTCCWACSSIF